MIDRAILALLACLAACSAPANRITGTPDQYALNACDIAEGKEMRDYSPAVTPVLRNISCQSAGPQDLELTCSFEAQARKILSEQIVPGSDWIRGTGTFRHPASGRPEIDKSWCATSWSGNLNQIVMTGSKSTKP